MSIFPSQSFPDPPFPFQLFPGSGNGFTSESSYANILLSVKATIQALVSNFGIYPGQIFPLNIYPTNLFPRGSGPRFGSPNVPITLYPERFQMAGGPVAMVMPEASYMISGQIMGDGRFMSGYNSSLRVRVVDSSLRDYTGSDICQLTNSSDGLLRTAHSIIDALDIRFPFDLDGVTPLTQEPMVLERQRAMQDHSGAKQYGMIDLIFKFPYTHEIIFPDKEYPLQDKSGPRPTNLADLLLSVRSAVLTQDFNDVTSVVTMGPQIFPLAGAPFCMIRPGDFNCIDEDKYGAGRYYATMEGEFTVTPVVMNVMDITGASESALIGENRDPVLCLYPLAQRIVENMQLYFLNDPDGYFIAENPLALKSIGVPYYFDKDHSHIALDLTFGVRYQEDIPA